MDQWEEAAKQFKQSTPSNGVKPLVSNEDWKVWTPQGSTLPPRVGGQKVLDYATDTLSNIPSSAAKLAGNIGHAVMNPGETIGNVGKVVTGTAQKMTPGYVTPERPGYSQEADAAWDALKNRYGSPHAIAESIRTDPVGVAADISAVAGGVSGVARGGAALADAANLPRVASTAGKVADVAGGLSDVVNPVSAVTKPLGAVAKGAARGLVRSALPGLGGRAERYGATPAQSVLEKTSGLTPSAVRKSALEHIADLNQKLDTVTARAKAAGATPDLTAARDVILQDIAKVKRANGLADDLTPMHTQLTEARPGFGGSVTPGGDITPKQDPETFLAMKRQFGDDFTQFDAAVPMKNSARKVGNRAYHELSTEFNHEVPGAEPINRELQSASPIPAAAQRAKESAGPVQRTVNRLTRPTGGALTALVLGPAGVAAQEALSSPTVKMGMARTSNAVGKGLKSPATSRTLNAAGVSGEISDTVAKRLSDAILGGQQ